LLDYHQNSLLERINEYKMKNRLFSEKEILILVEHICNALIDLSCISVGHGDIRPCMILIDSSNHYLLTNQYLLTNMKGYEKYNLNKTEYYYFSPQIIESINNNCP